MKTNETAMEKIIVNVDQFAVVSDINTYNQAMEIVETENNSRGLHFDDCPLMSIFVLCRADMADSIVAGEEDERHYWTRKIIERKGVKEKFDLLNYVKRAYTKPQKPRPMIPAYLRYQYRAWNNIFG